MAYIDHTPNDKGITLVEVMASVLVFMVGVMAMMAVFTASLRMSKQSTYVYKAHNLAKEHIETLKAVDFTLVATAGEADTIVDENGNADPAGEYRRTTVVTTPYNGHADLAMVTVSVNYTSRGAINPTPMQMTTLILDT